MFRGYNLRLDYLDFNEYHTYGSALNLAQKRNVRRELKSFLSKSGVIDASKLQDDWFPQIESDVFISHSHADEDLAISLAGWLNSEFSLTTFIDSSVWAYSNDLLKEIDDEYCSTSPGSYSYESRNYSTSHVHMMLSIALSKMIDRTECLLFLNTPQSVKVESVVKNKTNSPWIYSEISIAEIIRKQIPARHKIGRTKLFSKGGIVSLNESRKLEAEYILNLDHLTDIVDNDLEQWENYFKTLQRDRSLTALDCLYDQVPVNVRYNSIIHG